MNPFVTVVNQKRVYAELLLDQSHRAAGQKHLQQALLQGAVFQLEKAYRFYLREIAATYQCKNAEQIIDLWTLIANLQLMGKNPAETSEIYDLNQKPDTWLSDLHACCDSFLALPETTVSSPTEGDRIPALSSVHRYDWSNLDCAQVERWIASFGELVARQRQQMVEW